MAAIGLGALANLSGSANTMIVARQRYVSALSQTATLIKTQIRNRLDMYIAMKAVVLLALFEVRPSLGPVKTSERAKKLIIMVIDRLSKTATGQPVSLFTLWALLP